MFWIKIIHFFKFSVVHLKSRLKFYREALAKSMLRVEQDLHVSLHPTYRFCVLACCPWWSSGFGPRLSTQRNDLHLQKTLVLVRTCSCLRSSLGLSRGRSRGASSQVQYITQGGPLTLIKPCSDLQASLGPTPWPWHWSIHFTPGLCTSCGTAITEGMLGPLDLACELP